MRFEAEQVRVPSDADYAGCSHGQRQLLVGSEHDRAIESPTHWLFGARSPAFSLPEFERARGKRGTQAQSNGRIENALRRSERSFTYFPTRCRIAFVAVRVGTALRRVQIAERTEQWQDNRTHAQERRERLARQRAFRIGVCRWHACGVGRTVPRP